MYHMAGAFVGPPIHSNPHLLRCDSKGKRHSSDWQLYSLILKELVRPLDTIIRAVLHDYMLVDSVTYLDFLVNP